MEPSFIDTLVVILALLLFIIPIWFTINKVLNNFTRINTELIGAKIVIASSTFVASYILLIMTLNFLLFTFTFF